MRHLSSKALWLTCLLPFSGMALEVEVNIDGIKKELLDNARAGLSIVQKSQNRDLSLDQIEILYRRGPEEIEEALQPFGYYHSQVLSSIDSTTKPVSIHYTVTLNAPTTVHELELGLEGPGQHNPLLVNVLDDFPLKVGDVFEHDRYESGKDAILYRVNSEGYLQANFSKKDVLVDLSKHSADIHLRVDTGPHYTLGHVTFGPTYYAPEYLQRFVDFSEDEPFRQSTLSTLEEHLMMSNVFQSVIVTPQVQEGDTVAPVTVQLKDAAANRFLFGVGYDTNTQSRIRLGWDRKKINRYGHQFKANAKLSEQDTVIDAYYKIPGKHPWVDYYQLAVGYADQEFDEKPSELYTMELSETRDLWGWNRTIALRYLNERFKDSDFISDHSTFLLPSIRLSKSKLDDPFDPRNGYSIQLSVRGGLDAIIGDHNFIQFYGKYKWLRGLSERGTLILRTELGATFPDDVEELPLSIRFYAGGNDSLRGFKYRSLPPEINENGELRPVGGAYLALGSLEYNYQVWGPFKLAAFVDGGGAFRDSHDDPQGAAGVGLRWQTPVGPLKLDVAKPFTNAAQVWRLHFSFGPEI